MSNVEEELARIGKEMLQNMKERYRILGEGIAKLEDELNHPSFSSNLNIEAIKEKAKKDKAFLAKCERNRLERDNEASAED